MHAFTVSTSEQCEVRIERALEEEGREDLSVRMHNPTTRIRGEIY